MTLIRSFFCAVGVSLMAGALGLESLTPTWWAFAGGAILLVLSAYRSPEAK